MRDIVLSPYLAPPKILAGSKNKALINSKSPFTVSPISLKGRSRSQTMGYRRRARIAKGQQSSSKSSQSINLIHIDVTSLYYSTFQTHKKFFCFYIIIGKKDEIILRVVGPHNAALKKS